jgi:septal ring factor EnvC (AmiA/AmiB activator)
VRRVSLLAAILFSLLALPSAYAQPVDVDRRLKELEDQLRKSRADSDEIKHKAKELAGELQRLRSDTVAAARAAQESEELLSELEVQLDDLKVLEGDKAGALKRRSQQMTGVLTALQRLAWRPTEALIAQPQSPADTVRSAILLRAAVPQIEQSARDLKGEIDMLTRLRGDIGEQRKKIAATAGRLESEHSRIKTLFERKNQMREATEQEGIAAERRVRALAGEAEDLRDLLARLEEERQRRLAEAAIKAAAEKAAREAELAARKAAHEAEVAAQKAAREAELAAQRVERERRDREAAEHQAALDREAAQARTAREAELKSQREAQAKAQAEAREKELVVQAQARLAREAELKAQEQAKEKELAAQKATREAERASREAAAARPVRADKPFSSAHGKLPYPARGRVAARFGSTNDVGHVLKGVNIETRKGAQVVAPYDGQVVFSGPFRGYGLLLIIEHGEGYHTLLAGMAQIDCGVGQRLLGGEPVGVMGHDDTKPNLYVELRQNGQPINPLPWLTAQKSKVSG